MELQFFDKSDIIFCGDVHGKFRELGYNIIERYKIENSVIFVCGDFGMGFHKTNYYQVELHRLSEKIQKNNNILVAIRGNHDDPKWFEEINAFGQVYLIPDNQIVCVNGYNIIGIGGGISIDREQDHRILDKTYWAGENIIVNEDVLSKVTDIDFVFTHSSPKFCEPLSKIGIQIFLNDDTKLRDDLNKEREDVTRIYDILKVNNKISKWCYGHFHNSYYLNKDGVDFYGLDELELKSVYK